MYTIDELKLLSEKLKEKFDLIEDDEEKEMISGSIAILEILIRLNGNIETLIK